MQCSAEHLVPSHSYEGSFKSSNCIVLFGELRPLLPVTNIIITTFCICYVSKYRYLVS
jgi:hypothetical protein